MNMEAFAETRAGQAGSRLEGCEGEMGQAS